MKIKKKVQGHYIILDYKKAKKYKNFTMYDVFKQGVFLYSTSLTKLQLRELKEAGYLTSDEEVIVNDVCCKTW